MFKMLAFEIDIAMDTNFDEAIKALMSVKSHYIKRQQEIVGLKNKINRLNGMIDIASREIDRLRNALGKK